MLTYVYTHCTQGVLPWLSSPVELLFGHIQRLVVESVNKGNSSELQQTAAQMQVKTVPVIPSPGPAHTLLPSPHNVAYKVGEVVACFARCHARRVSKVGNVAGESSTQ